MHSRIERQNLLHVQRSIMKEEYPRGSTEETRKILQQIERINMALGYKRRQSVAFPRVASNEGYFYPRQQFRPEFLTRPRENNLRMNNRRAIYPFNNQNYYYPAPYLQTPSDEGAQAFNPNFYPLVYMPLNGLSGLRYEYNTIGDEKERSIKLGTIVVLPAEDRASKALETPKKVEKKAGKNKGKPEESESSIIDDFVNIVPDALGFSDEDEDDRQEPIVSSTLLPSIKNDKFLNLALKKHPQEEYDEERQLVPTPVKNNVNRAFNFSSNFQKPIEKLQNFTKQFSFNQSQAKEVDMEVNPSTPSAEDIEDAEDDKADDKEDAKSPFGFAFGPTQQLETYKKGGLIIQRLKVRRGGIAIAGPGGVATVRKIDLVIENSDLGKLFVLLGGQRRNGNCGSKWNCIHSPKVL